MSQSQDSSGGRLRLVIPKAALKREESVVSPQKEPPQLGLIIGPSSLQQPTLQLSPPKDERRNAIALGSLVVKSSQWSFRQLENIDELMGRMGDAERKAALLECLVESRLVFAKLLGVAEWRARLGDINSVNEAIAEVEEEKSMKITELADRLCVRHYDYGKLESPIFELTLSLDLLLSSGNHSGYPKIITDYVHADEELEEQVKSKYIHRLDRLLAVHLAQLSLPAGCRVERIERGVLYLQILDNEATLELSLVPGSELTPRWFLINCRPTCGTARDKIKGALGVMLQTKYNDTSKTERFSLDSIVRDVELYRSLYWLHQLYSQLSLLRRQRQASLKLEHSEGLLKAQFYPNISLSADKLLLTVRLVGAKFETVCLWDPSFAVTASFDCSNHDNVVFTSAYEYLCRTILNPLRDHFGDYAVQRDCKLEFQFGGLQAHLSLVKNSGVLMAEYVLDGKKQTITPSSSTAATATRDVVIELKRVAVEAAIAQVSHPRLAYCFSTAEQSKIGSFPKVFLSLDDGSVFLSIGISPDDLKSRCNLVYTRPDTRYPLMRIILHNEPLTEQSQNVLERIGDLVNNVKYRQFKFVCLLREHNYDFSILEDGSANCHSLPMHICVRSVRFIDEQNATIELEKEYLPLDDCEDCILLTASSFDHLVEIVREYLRLLLFLSQLHKGTVVGTLSPLNIMAGNHMITLSLDNHLLLDGNPLTSTTVNVLFSARLNKL